MKLFLKVFAGIIVLTILAAVIVITVVDPNDYKQQIQDQVKKSTNRDLVITGDLGWSLYPLLGFQSGELTLSNTPDFEEKTLLNVNEAAISINVLPLFSGNLEVGEIMLDGVVFNFITNKDGLTNLEKMQASTDAQTVDEQAGDNTASTSDGEQASTPVDLSKFVLSGINITDAKVNVIDHQKGETQQVTVKSMLLSEFAFDQKAHLSLTTTFKNEQLSADVSIESDIFVDASLTTIELTNLIIESEVEADALSGSTVSTTFTSGLKYQPESKQLNIKAITLNNTFSGSFLNGTVYINSSDIDIADHNQVSLGKLTLTSSLTGEALQNNLLETNLQTNLGLNLQKKTAIIDSFDVKNKVSGKDAQGDINLSFNELTVSDFEKVIIKQFELAAELTAPAVTKDKITSRVNSEISYDLAQQKLSLTSLKSNVNDIQLNGELSVVQKEIPVIRYNLQGNVWNLNPYLNTTSTTEQSSGSSTTGSTKPATVKEVEPDLSILKDLDVQGTLTIAGILYENITIGKITNGLTVKNGRATVKPLDVNLYDGTLSVNAWVDESAGQNKYQATTTLKNVVLMQLLKDAAQIDILSGTANMNLTANGQGLTATKIKQGVVAKGDFRILDGELYGINLPYEIRVIKAKIQGKTIEPDKLVKKTDFASLIGQFTVAKGIANNQKLTMLSPIIRLDGAGTADIINQKIDYKLGVTPLSKTDESTSYADLSGISIPLRIQGTFDKPTFALDIEDALKAQAEAAKQLVEDKAQQVIQDKAKDILSGKKVSKDDLKEEAKDLENALKGLF